MNRAEWVQRCAQRLKRNRGMQLNDARAAAADLASKQDADYGPSGAWQPPDDAADAYEAEPDS